MTLTLQQVASGEQILPPGVHAATPAQIKACFVDLYPLSSVRWDIWEGWVKFRTLLHLVLEGVPFREFIDGSFVTSRQHPSDIDIAIELDAAHVDALPGLRADAFDYLTLGKHSDSVRVAFKTEVIAILTCEQGHDWYPAFLAMQKDFDDLLKYRDISGRVHALIPKGIIEVVEEIP